MKGYGIKCILLTLLVLMLSAEMSAQTHYVAHTTAGFRGGVSISNVSFNPSVEQSMSMGYTLGASFTYAEERHVGLRVELNLTQRGWKENFEELSNEFNYRRSLTYVELPIMTHIFFGGRRVKCLFNLGPQFGYMISENIKANFDYEHPSSVPGFPTQNRTNDQLSLKVKNKFDYGITAGVGAEFLINRKNSIQVEARYYFGLGNIYPSTKKDVFSASRNQSILATVGYFFRIK